MGLCMIYASACGPLAHGTFASRQHPDEPVVLHLGPQSGPGAGSRAPRLRFHADPAAYDQPAGRRARRFWRPGAPPPPWRTRHNGSRSSLPSSHCSITPRCWRRWRCRSRRSAAVASASISSTPGTRPELERAGVAFPEHDERYVYGAEWLESRSQPAGRQADPRFSGKYFAVHDYMPASGIRVSLPPPQSMSRGESEAGACPSRRGTAMCFFLNSRKLEENLGNYPATFRRGREARRQKLRFAMSAFVIARPTEREAQEELAYARELFFRDRGRRVEPGA